jgi:hypothetical protein
VHRDVKPGNVLIEDRDGQEHVYLTDFGLTKRMSGATELTASGAFIGTLEYMAPEQIRGGELDARTDVYALGGVAFATLTGEPPFGRVEGDVAKLYAHLNDPPPRASERAPGLPLAIDPVLQRAMAKKPDERYRSAGEFARALEAAVGETPAAAPERTVEAAPAEPPTAPLAPPRPQGRRRALGVLAGLLVVAAVVGAIALAGGDGGGDAGEETTVGDNGTATDVPGIVAREDAGDFPVGVTVDGDRVLVASRDDGLLSAMSTADADRIASFQLSDAEPDFLVPGFDALWTADGINNELVEIDPSTLEPTDRSFPTGEFPRDVLVTDDAIWVANRDSDSLTRVDPDAGAVEEFEGDGDFPRRLAYDGERIWTAYKFAGDVQAFDATTGEPGELIDVGGEPHGLLVAAGFLWIANTGSDSVQKLALDDPTGPVETFRQVCDEPRDIELAFEALWVTCGLGRAVKQLDPETGRERGEVPVETQLETIASSENPDRIWVGGGGSGKLIVIDPAGV